MPYKYESTFTLTEYAAMFNKDLRTVRTWLQGLEPDEKGTGGRGNASRWYFYRVMKHCGYPLAHIEIGVAFAKKLTKADVHKIADILESCRKAENNRRPCWSNAEQTKLPKHRRG